MQQAGRRTDRRAGKDKKAAAKAVDNEACNEDENEAEQWVDISKLPVKCVLQSSST